MTDITKVASYPLPLKNVGSTCYLNSVMQMLYACHVNWRGTKPNPLSDLFVGLLMDKNIDIEEFVTRLTGIFGHNLRVSSDPKEFFWEIIRNFKQHDSTVLEPFKFIGCMRGGSCKGCGQVAEITDRPETLFCKMIPFEGTVQQAFEASLDRKMYCLECSCPTAARYQCQYETIRFKKYPEVMILISTPNGVATAKPFVVSRNIITYNGSKYECVGIVLGTPGFHSSGHVISMVKHKSNWFECNDSTVQIIPEEQVFTSHHMYPEVLAYRKCEN